MNVGLPLRNTNGACGNGSRTALMWAPSEEPLCVFFMLANLIVRFLILIVPIVFLFFFLYRNVKKIFGKGILCDFHAVQ